MAHDSIGFRLLAGIGALFAFAATVISQGAGSLTLNEPFRGTIPSERTIVPGANGKYSVFGTYLPIRLEEGQRVTITADAIGDGRDIGLAIEDPGEVCLNLGASGPRKGKTAQFAINEVAATGVYKIYVFSDRPGGFRLQVTSPKVASVRSGGTPTKDDIKSLEQLVERLENELFEAKTKLKALREKQKQGQE